LSTGGARTSDVPGGDPREAAVADTRDTHEDRAARGTGDVEVRERRADRAEDEEQHEDEVELTAGATYRSIGEQKLTDREERFDKARRSIGFVLGPIALLVVYALPMDIPRAQQNPAAVLSTFISNTATVAMLLPTALGILGTLVVLMRRDHDVDFEHAADAEGSLDPAKLRLGTALEEREKLGSFSVAERNTLIAFTVAVVLWVLPGIVGLVAGTDSSAYETITGRLDEGVVAVVAASLLFFLPVNWPRREFTMNSASPASCPSPSSPSPPPSSSSSERDHAGRGHPGRRDRSGGDGGGPAGAGASTSSAATTRSCSGGRRARGARPRLAVGAAHPDGAASTGSCATPSSCPPPAGAGWPRRPGPTASSTPVRAGPRLP
jgi:hypothetical protein